MGWEEVAVVEEGAGFGDDEEGEDGPVWVSGEVGSGQWVLGVWGIEATKQDRIKVECRE